MPVMIPAWLLSRELGPSANVVAKGTALLQLFDIDLHSASCLYPIIWIMGTSPKSRYLAFDLVIFFAIHHQYEK